MTEQYAVHVFYPDGGDPESGTQVFSQLSDRWLSVCSEMLDDSGPAMNRKMGGTLAHFSIQLAGPIGQLSAYGYCCFEIAISLGNQSDQDHVAVRYFRDYVERAATLAGVALAFSAAAVLDDAAASPCLLMFDTCQQDVDDDQKAALAQLGIHMAGAYLRYRETQLNSRENKSVASSVKSPRVE